MKPSKEKVEGYFEVGVSANGREVVINADKVVTDSEGRTHWNFSPNQARTLGKILLKAAARIDTT
jgi:hypothetical protein